MFLPLWSLLSLLLKLLTGVAISLSFVPWYFQDKLFMACRLHAYVFIELQEWNLTLPKGVRKTTRWQEVHKDLLTHLTLDLGLRIAKLYGMLHGPKGWIFQDGVSTSCTLICISTTEKLSSEPKSTSSRIFQLLLLSNLSTPNHRNALETTKHWHTKNGQNSSRKQLPHDLPQFSHARLSTVMGTGDMQSAKLEFKTWLRDMARTAWWPPGDHLVTTWCRGCMNNDVNDVNDCECMDNGANEWLTEWMQEWIGRWLNEWINAWIHQRVTERRKEQTNAHIIYIHIILYILIYIDLYWSIL
jgi:hypothetical protein